MNYSLYSVKDVKAGFMSPVVAANDAQAMRSFRAGMRSVPEYQIAPTDFELYRIGQFDDVGGLVEPVVPPAFVCSGITD